MGRQDVGGYAPGTSSAPSRWDNATSAGCKTVSTCSAASRWRSLRRAAQRVHAPNQPVEMIRALLWLFIVAVAVLDTGFSWRHAKECYEMPYEISLEDNPVPRWAFALAGMPGVTLYRWAWLGFAWVMSTAKVRQAKYVLPVWTVGHGLLLVLLVWTVMMLR